MISLGLTFSESSSDSKGFLFKQVRYVSCRAMWRILWTRWYYRHSPLPCTACLQFLWDCFSRSNFQATLNQRYADIEDRIKIYFHEQQTAFWVVSSRFRMCGVSNRCIHRHWTWDWSTHSKWYCYELVSREIRDLTYVLPFVRCFQCVVLGICVCEFWTRCGIFWQAWSIKSRLLLGRYSHPVFIARSWFGRYIAINVGRVLSEKLGSWGTQPRSLASLEMVSGSSTEA